MFQCIQYKLDLDMEVPKKLPLTVNCSNKHSVHFLSKKYITKWSLTYNFLGKTNQTGGITDRVFFREKIFVVWATFIDSIANMTEGGEKLN